jgi:hypothetical protein
MSQYVRPGSNSAPIAINDVISIITPTSTMHPAGCGCGCGSGGGGGISLQDLMDAIAAAALDTTDDLPEGTSNRYFTTARVAYTHNQNAVSNSWVINHNLGFRPNVTVQDSAGTIYEGEINYTNANSLTVSFSAAFSGKAYLS